MQIAAAGAGKMWAVLLAITVALTGAQVARAQPDPGFSGHVRQPDPAFRNDMWFRSQKNPASTSEKGERADASGLSDRFIDRETAKCVLKRYGRTAVDHFLELPSMSGAASKLSKDLASNQCRFTSKYLISEEFLRGGLYAVLYALDYADSPGMTLGTPVDFAADVAVAPAQDAATYVWLHQFADCVVRADPVDSRVLVLAPVESPAEGAGFAALAPHFNGCLTTGHSVTLTKGLLSVLISEALYRETKAALASNQDG